MDVQRTIVERLPIESVLSYLPNLSRTISAARDAKVPILYVVVGFPRNHPEINLRSMSFGRNPTGSGFTEGDPAAEIHPDVAPHEGDVVIAKRRVSAFMGTDLEIVLRSLGAETLVLRGIAMSGVVLSTLRQAADLDYRVTVLK